MLKLMEFNRDIKYLWPKSWDGSLMHLLEVLAVSKGFADRIDPSEIL